MFKYNHVKKYHKSVVNFENFTLQYLLNPGASGGFPQSPLQGFAMDPLGAFRRTQALAYNWRPLQLQILDPVTNTNVLIFVLCTRIHNSDKNHIFFYCLFCLLNVHWWNNIN